MPDSVFDRLAHLLQQRPHRAFAPDDRLPLASVALLLRPGGKGPELLLIRRAERPEDPWSGHMALPGGRAEPGEDAEATAARETLEEVGIDLHHEGRLLGRLDQVRPVSQRAPKILVSPFVYAVEGGARAEPNPEVALALWLPLAELLSSDAITEFLYELEDGTSISLPAYGAAGHLVWGLTHRILTGFIRVYRDCLENP